MAKFTMSSVQSKDIVCAKKQENMRLSDWKYGSLETNPEVTEMMVLSGQNTEAVITTQRI